MRVYSGQMKCAHTGKDQNWTDKSKLYAFVLAYMK